MPLANSKQQTKNEFCLKLLSILRLPAVYSSRVMLTLFAILGTLVVYWSYVMLLIMFQISPPSSVGNMHLVVTDFLYTVFVHSPPFLQWAISYSLETEVILWCSWCSQMPLAKKEYEDHGAKLKHLSFCGFLATHLFDGALPRRMLMLELCVLYK